jgi:hypothetical protein
MNRAQKGLIETTGWETLMAASQKVDWNGGSKTGLVVELPEVRSLWDNRLHRVLDALEERLEGVFVTVAAASGKGPTLRDAVAAARLMGCRSVVVVSAEGGRKQVDDDLPLFVIPVRISALTLDGVVAAYSMASSPQWIEACA